MEILRITFPTDEIHCSLCKKRYTDPRILPCLHSFCHKCLLGVALKKGQGLTIQCPKCKKDHHVTDTGCAELPTNVHILGLIQLHKVKSEKERKCFVCQLSKNTSDATHLCLSCNDLLCCTCSKGHNSASVTASHKVVNLDDIMKGKYDLEIYNKIAISCDKHEGKEYMLYCDDCQTMICIKCTIDDHRKHIHTPLEDVITTKQKLLHQCLKQISSDKDEVFKTIEKRISKVEENEKKFEHKLNTEVASVIDQLQREKKEVLERAKTFFTEDKRELYELESSIKKSNAIEDMYRLMVTKGGSGFVMMSASLEKGITTLKESVNVEMPRFKAITATVRGMNVQENLIAIQENVQNLQILKQTDPDAGERSDATRSLQRLPTTDADGIMEKFPLEKMVACEVKDAETQPNQSTSSEDVAVALDYQNHFVAKVSKDYLQPAISSLSLYAGELLLFDINNMKIKIYTIRGKFKILWRVTVLPERAVFSEYIFGISDGKLEIYSIPPCKVVKMHVKLPFESPDFPPVISKYKDNQVLVANLPNNETKIFDNKGNLKQTRKTCITGPIVSVQWNKTGKIIMCSWKDAGSVQIESDEGELLLEIHKLVDGKQLPDWRPVDACMSSLGFIVVADSKRNELSVFDPQGLELMVLNTSEDEFTHPGRLVIDDDDNLFVCGKDGLIVRYRVSCYSVKYTKLRK